MAVGEFRVVMLLFSLGIWILEKGVTGAKKI